MKSRLLEAGFQPDEVEGFGLLADACWTGHLVGIIRDAAGRPLTFWGWDISGRPDEGVRCFHLKKERKQVVTALQNDDVDGAQSGFSAESLPNVREPKPPVEGVRDVVEEVEIHTSLLDHYAGREYIGLPQRVLEGLDEATLGLRGLLFLAAPANVGRTALTVQLGTDVVIHNEDACFLFVSLEMSRWDILTRIKSRLAGMDWKRLVLGSRQGPEKAAYTLDEVADILQAERMMERIGRRVRILDQENCPELTVETVLENLRQLETKTGANRAFVVVDHLQVGSAPVRAWQEPPFHLKRTKAQVAAMMNIRDAIKDGAVMAVLDVRTPSKEPGDTWWYDLADATGSCQGNRCADMAFSLRPLDEEELRAAYMKQHGDSGGNGGSQEYDVVQQWKRTLQKKDGITLNKLAIAKGRDGVEKEELDLTFYFRRSEFEEGLPQWDSWRNVGTRLSPRQTLRWKSIAR